MKKMEQKNKAKLEAKNLEKQKRKEKQGTANYT